MTGFSPTTLKTSEFQDGQAAGSITPARLRDLIDSAFGVYTTQQPPNLMGNANPVAGAVVGSSGGSAGTFSGTLPTNWTISGQGNLVGYVVGFGVVAPGYSYIDINFSGTSSTTGLSIFMAGNSLATAPNVSASTSYTAAAAIAYVTSATGITNFSVGYDSHTSGGGYIASPGNYSIATSATLAEYTGAGSSGASAAYAIPWIGLIFPTSTTISCTVRIANPQLLLTSTATTYTLQAADQGTVVEINSSASFTVTFPSGIFTAGQSGGIRQTGAGAVTLSGATGITPTSATGNATTRAQGSLLTWAVDANLPGLVRLDGDIT